MAGAERFGLVWALPFVGMILSIALGPIVAPGFWHRRYGRVTAFWAAAFVLPYLVRDGIGPTAHLLAETALHEYIPFIVLLGALYTIAGGIRIIGRLRGTPAENAALLLAGTLLAGWMGTTGAAMLMIRPVLRANRWRRHRAHVVVFFIILVANVGGGLTPLGDPPLFLGFLQGVSFFWPTVHLAEPLALLAGWLLALFLVVDLWLYAREPDREQIEHAPESFGIQGAGNLLLLAGVVAVVLLAGLWDPGFALHVAGVDWAVQDVVRDVALVGLGWLSLRAMGHEARDHNGFTWGPMAEVAELFTGIFITIVPAIALLREGTHGPLAGLVSALTGPAGPRDGHYFWASGVLSAFLDNAPTYLVFFNMAGGDAQHLMTEMASTLAAISLGSVVLGAATYIGNAPNFMVRSIAKEHGVRMPGFFTYLGWTALIMGPVCVVVTLLFFPH